MRDELATTLQLLEELGVEWKRTRFRRYLDSLSWAASLTYPRELAFADELVEQQLFFEASSQAQQLALSATTWRLLDGGPLRDRLNSSAPVVGQTCQSRTTIAMMRGTLYSN